MSDEEKKDLKKSKPVDKGEASSHRKAQKLAAQKSAKVKNRKPLRAIFPLAGLIAALLAGGIGGFVSHEYFDAPPPPPDLSAFKAQIEDLDEAVKAQTVRSGRLERQLTTAGGRFDDELTKLDQKWAGELSALSEKIARTSVQPSLASTDSNTALSEITDDSIGSEVLEGETVTDNIVQTAIEPRVEILEDIETLRRNFGQDITNIKVRLDILEQQDLPSETKITSTANLPMAQILSHLGPVQDDPEDKGWFDKLVKKHVSVKRTDYDKAAAILQKMEVAIGIGDWESAAKFAQELPEPARVAAQEWIASERP